MREKSLHVSQMDDLLDKIEVKKGRSESSQLIPLNQF